MQEVPTCPFKRCAIARSPTTANYTITPSHTGPSPNARTQPS